MTGTRYKRRNYFIKKNFQGKLILGYFLFVVMGCLIFTVILAVLSADSLTVIYQDNDLQIGQTPFMLVKQLITANWIFIVAGSVFIVFAAMMITHRLAGPLFHLERAVDNMSRGQLNDIIFLREKDEGKELAAKLNHFNKELSQDLKHIERQSHNIEDLLVQFSSLNPKNATFEDCDSLFDSIARQNMAVQEIIEKYQLLDE
ncbi:MAG TPA: methyl-accepting chemotaxis protein [Desulfocapsa sulfexigens]|nr:methyl-accepting chemotaxis protein [Desulfocapsa sulfexigens]HIQ36880.1 methyl-accepting chemotaxis protein [Desulfocapsa sulfexigens]